MTADEQLVLDAVAAAATPGTTEADVRGWRVKASPDLPFRRCNVAVPAVGAASTSTAAADLAAVRAALHEHHRRLVVAVSSARSDGQALDAWLADEGLGLEAPVQIMVADVAHIAELATHRGVLAGAAVDVTVEAGTIAPDPVGVVGTGSAEEAREAGYRMLLRRVAATGRCPVAAVARMASAPTDGGAVGLGFAVVDGSWVGIFGMVTSPAHRRRGIAVALVRALADAARANGATRAYLQVEEANGPAIALYERLGFTTSHRHHYRSEPAADEHGTIAEAGC